MPVFDSNLEKDFDRICDTAFNETKGKEEIFINIRGEDSQFIRFNKNKIRQNGLVSDLQAELILVENNKKYASSFPITRKKEFDNTKVKNAVKTMRNVLADLPENPHVVGPKNYGNSSFNHGGELLDYGNVANEITNAFGDVDMTGFYAAGPVVEAVANSAGTKHWFSNISFTFDYSIWTKDEKGVKGHYAGNQWNPDNFNHQVKNSLHHFALLNEPTQELKKGKYRVYLGPAAVADILVMFSWMGLGESDIRQKRSAFLPMREFGKSLSEKITLSEDFSKGMVPRFNEQGELAPEQITLLENGNLKNTLINSRTAKEYGLEENGASHDEGARSLNLCTGNLSEESVFESIKDGLYLSNLHYLNWSDNANGRLTGMTRFACFLIENGRIKGPIQNMRFDETIYNALGDQLIEITDFQEFVPNLDTYNHRHIGGMHVPGLLVDNFEFTL